MRRVLVIALLGMGGGCAQLHHVQVGEMDNTHADARPFEVKVSDTGFDLSEAARITKAVSHSRTVDRTADTVSDVWELITFGPKTGEVTFSDEYADNVAEFIEASCPVDRIVGLVAIRESNKYPVISGEIVRIVGYCRGSQP